MKYTPPNWEIGYGVIRVDIHEMNGKIIATIPRDDEFGRPFSETQANALLIAAAPDLLALLVESQSFIGGDWRERRDAAVAKATGSAL